MSFRHPFQKLCIVPANDAHSEILLAASGPTINCLSITDEALLFQWPSRQDGSDEGNDPDLDRPNKRRKVDSNGLTSLSRQQSEASDVSIEIVAERKKGDRKKSKIIDTKVPNVSHILATSDGKHVIAVTAEDKAIRVFTISPKGKLTQVSSRCLPKKLCAIRLTKEETTLLVADKFGDVYALPLHESEEWRPKAKVLRDTAFKPAATELTVHTKGNRDALRQQLEHKQNLPKKESPTFEHKVILGHVSLLTDLVVAEGTVEGKSRPYILTSDRDEHIRVSRGIPQAHVIETFCLAHEEFVTRLCIPPMWPHLLIAGNGEPTLRVYEWQSGTLTNSGKGTLGAWVHILLEELEPPPVDGGSLALPEGRTEEKLAVSGIWCVDFSATTNTKGTPESLLLVALEGIPCLLTYYITPDGLFVLSEGHLNLKGNVLDVAMLDSTRQILVSIDNVHRPFSMKAYREEEDVQIPPFQAFKLQSKDHYITIPAKYRWESVKVPFDMPSILKSLPEAPTITPEDTNRKRDDNIFSQLGEFLYGLENLRKKRNFTADEEAAMEAEAEAETGEAMKAEEAVEVVED